MAYSDAQWAKVRAYYERGLSLSEIVARDDVLIKSRGSISKRANAEGWQHGIKKQTVSKEVQVKHELAEITKQKETMPAEERGVHESLVSERLRHEAFFRGGNLLIANTIASKVKTDGLQASFQDLNAAASGFVKTQEAVLGKQPDTVINNNAQSTAQVAAVLPPADEYARILADLARRL